MAISPVTGKPIPQRGVPQTPSIDSIDFDNPQFRSLIFEKLGIEEPKPQANLLERFGSFFSAFELGNASFEFMKSGDAGKAMQTYLGDIVQGIGGAFTGDIDRDKKTFADVFKEMGIEDETIASVLGFAADVALDPTTYVSFGFGSGIKVGGKTLTTTGKTVYKAAKETAELTIKEYAGKSIGKLDEFTEAATKFAKEAGIVLEGPLKPKNVEEIIQEFAEKRVKDFSRLSGEELTVKTLTDLGIEKTQKELAGKLAQEAFEKPEMRFMGKKVFELGERGAKLGSAVVDPVSMSASFMKKLPVIREGAEKLNNGLFKRLGDSMGKLFDPMFEARKHGLITLDRTSRNMLNMIELHAKRTGAEVTGKFWKPFQQAIKDGENFRPFVDLVEDLNVMLAFGTDSEAYAATAKFLKRQTYVEASDLADFFGMDARKFSREQWREAGQMFTEHWAAGNREGMLRVAGNLELKPLKEAMMKQVDTWDKAGIDYLQRRMGQVLDQIEDKPLQKKLQSQLKKIDKPLKRGTRKQKLTEIINLLPEGDAKKFLNIEMQRFDNPPRFVKMGPSIVINENTGLGKLAIEVQGMAKERAQMLKDMDLPNLQEHLTRKAITKKGEVLDEAGTAYNPLSRTNPNRVVGKTRVEEFKSQGVFLGQIQYETDQVLKGRNWGALTKKEQNKYAELITQRIFESEVRAKAAESMWRFQNYIKFEAVFDDADEFGDKLSLEAFTVKKIKDVKTGKYKEVLKRNITKERLELLKKRGWRTPAGMGPNMKGWWVAPEAADLLEGSYRAFFTDEGTNEILKMFDNVMRVWKTSVTAWFPAFHVRNGISNILANLMSGLKNPLRYKDAGRLQRYMSLQAQASIEGGGTSIARKLSKLRGAEREAFIKTFPKIDQRLLEEGGKKLHGITLANWVDLMETRAVVTPNTIWQEATGKASVTNAGQLKKINPASQDFFFTSSGRRLGNWVEDNARIALFVDQVKKGNGFDDAAFKVRQTLFDYSELTEFEKNIMRRVVPFYTWARKNAEFMIRFATANPGKFGAGLKLMRDMRDALTNLPPEDIEALPAWAKDGFAVITGTGTNASVITGFGTPIEAFTENVGSLLGTEQKSALNFVGPIPKGIIESATGVSLFTGKRLAKDNNGKKFRNLPQFLKDAIGYREVKRESKDGTEYIEYIVDPGAKQVINLFLGRGAATLGHVANVQDDPNFLPWLNLVSGIKRYEFNVTQEEERRQKESARLLLDILERKGLASEFTITNVHKEGRKELGL